MTTNGANTMNRTEKRRKIKEYAKAYNMSVKQAKAHFDTLNDNEINNIELRKKHNSTLDVFLNSDPVKDVIKTTMESDAPAMSINQIGEVAGWFNLPKYQQDANEAWVQAMHDKLVEGGVWYFEYADTLFVKKDHGFACIGGGLKEMGIIS